MSELSEALKARSMKFATAVLQLVDRLPSNPGAQVVGRQLAKSATSMGANYRAACYARSRQEFIAKLGVVVEESDESVFWLELMATNCYRPESETRGLLREAVELRAI